jgi:replicative DNA helicase
MSLARSVPFDIQAEQATLGSILIERTAIIPVAAWLLPDAFYLEKHALIYTAMLACYVRREPPDLATVAAELRRQEQLELVGGLAFLSDLAGAVPTAVHVEYYATIVQRTATLRRLIEVGGHISALGYRESDELDDVLGQAEAALQSVVNRRSEGSVSIGLVINQLFAHLERMQERRGELTGIPTGYRDLDDLTGGLQNSDLLLLAARPSVGKTAMALSLAYNIANIAQRGVGIFSLEMSREQLVQRLLAMHTGIDMQRFRAGTLRGHEIPLAIEGMGMLASLPIEIDDTPGLSIGELRARARRMCAEHAIDVLIVDYLQLLSGGRKNDNRVQEVSEVSRGLKALARELNLPLIALSQLSRAVEGRQSHVPLLSDLRESGSLEQDSDIVMFIYREELYDRETDKKGIAELHIAKHRNGPLGIVPLRFESRTTRFHHLDRYQAPTGY